MSGFGICPGEAGSVNPDMSQPPDRLLAGSLCMPVSSEASTDASPAKHRVLTSAIVLLCVLLLCLRPGAVTEVVSLDMIVDELGGNKYWTSQARNGWVGIPCLARRGAI